ncbi:MAG: tetratricopeptide repeat protein [Verrucomicrobia bacterium]|nr:tetratricopeptide repeat protein [Verrucomicrobiota bacterium]
MNSFNHRELLNQGLVHHRDNRYAEAAALYQKVLDENPRQHDALYLMGVALRQQNQFEPALDVLERALQVRPDLARTHQELGVVLFALKRLDDSIASLNRAIQMQPEASEAHEYLGHVYHESCYFEQAVVWYQKALDLNPQSASARENIGIIQTRQQALRALGDQCKSLSQGLSVPLSTGPKLESRDLLPHFLNELGLLGSGAEIGVQRGEYSEHLLRHWKGRLLYSIDPWRELLTEQYVDIANVSQSRHDKLYAETIRKLMRFQQRSVIWRLTSKEAADLVPDDSLDFC